MQELKLLIIEDDLDQRELIRETLDSRFGEGTVTAVGSAAEALACELEKFDLILSDYNLPDGSGLDLLAKIKARCDTPVILVTGENVGQIATTAIRAGATDYIVKIDDYLFTIPLMVEKNLAASQLRKENERLGKELEKALAELRDRNVQLEQSLKRVEEVAATDPLTGLYNRRHFGKLLEQLFSEAHRYDSDLSCIMLDLDGYKQFNDTHGHQAGDQMLVVLGKVIASNLRTMDVSARYGGDEFILLLPKAGTQKAALAANRIREDFRSASRTKLVQTHSVTMSVGIASIHGDRPVSADQLVAAADKSLYRAKEGGRDRIAISNEPIVAAGGASRPIPRH